MCGVQGSGKSHTVSVLLENMLLTGSNAIGSMDKPLCGLVLHFGEGGPESQPSEATWLGSPLTADVGVPKIVVYVSPSSVKTMRKVYARVGPHVTVHPLVFNQAELDAKAFMSLMSIGSSDDAPLYMQTVLVSVAVSIHKSVANSMPRQSLLRELGEDYTYPKFLKRLEVKKRDLMPVQLTGLKQRMELLDTFLDKTKNPAFSSRFNPGQLTIVDLSDQFIDPEKACVFFEILVRLFVRATVDTGKVLVLDEAHKVSINGLYLSSMA